MGSIRPLVTITILVVVGAYLYVKINEGPVRPGADKGVVLNQLPDGVPPLQTTKGASLATESSAPAWPSNASTAATPAPVSVPPAATSPNPGGTPTMGNPTVLNDVAKNNLPSVPPIPELPEFPAATAVTPPAAPASAALPKDLPADIPTARYPDEPGQNATKDTAKDALNPALPFATNTDPGKLNSPIAADRGAVTPPISSPAASSAQSPSASSALQQPVPSAAGTTSAAAPQAASQNPLRPAQTPPSATESVDRYASAATTSQLVPVGPAPNQVVPPIETSFAASWPTIQAALDRGDLKQAHQLLSKWHGNESLTPADSERVEKLLSQLAGTVIYSSEHQLEPPRVVKPAETLDTIAKEYNVPWQLLAKINGIQGPDQLRPGQELKVVRGPFSAVVDLHRSEVTLMVDDRYAGKFRVSVPPGAAITDGQWLVDQKLAGPASTANPNAFATTPVPADRTIILRNATANAAAPTLLIASGPSPAGIASSPPSLRVSPQDAEELSDILSIGSRVIVRR